MKWFVAETTFTGKAGGLIQQNNKFAKSEPAAPPPRTEQRTDERVGEGVQSKSGGDGWQVSSQVQYSEWPRLQTRRAVTCRSPLQPPPGFASVKTHLPLSRVRSQDWIPIHFASGEEAPLT